MDVSQIKRFVFSDAGSNMYIIAENCLALVIDPNVSENALQYLYDKKVEQITVMLTHEHYDHTTGLTWLCDKFKSLVICQEEAADSLRSGKDSRPLIIISHYMCHASKEGIKELTRNLPQNYKYTPDITFSRRYDFKWQDHHIKMVSTPGHSPGGCCIEIDNNVVATGDSLILGAPAITRFPGGSAEQYQKQTVPYLRGLRDDILILPGHGEVFYMKDVNL